VSAAQPVLEVRNLVAGYVKAVDILRGVDLHVDQHEVVTIIGPNGAGKSTLIKSVCGLLCPSGGKIVLDGEDITGQRPYRVARLGVGYVPQRDNVFPSLTVEENLQLGGLRMRAVVAKRRVNELLELFPGLQRCRRRRAGLLSGGERQMVAMARALMPEPALLLLDEPSAGLAPAAADSIFDQIANLSSHQTTVLMVEQNARRALTISDRGYVLDLGRNGYHGLGRDLLVDPNVGALYLGMGAPGAANSEAHGRRTGDPVSEPDATSKQDNALASSPSPTLGHGVERGSDRA